MKRLIRTVRLWLLLLLWVNVAASAGETRVTVHPAPKGSPVSKDYTLTVGGKSLDVYRAPKSMYGAPVLFAYCDMEGRVDVAVRANFIEPKAVTSMSLHPLSMKIEAKRSGNTLTFSVDKPRSITVLVNGQHKNRPLHLFLNPPAEPPPEDALVFGPGKHKLDPKKPIRLKDGQTVHIAGGAWVEGRVLARNAENISVTGRGVLFQPTARRSLIRLRDCKSVSVGRIILTRNARGWCGVAQNCDDVTVRGLHIVSPVKPSTDGFNPCNSRNVTIEDCFFRTGDDCIAIKGNTGGPCSTRGARGAKSRLDIDPQTQPPCENITVRRCVFWSEFNNVLCIGAETRAKHFRNIRFEDCDILFHGPYRYGAISILPLHGTEISHITYENIRVEHTVNQLFCFKIGERLYGGIPGFHKFPGGISNVTIKDIFVSRQAGGPRSSFAGWSKRKQVKNVTIQGVRYSDTLMRDAKSMGLHCNEYVSNVRFLDPPAEKPKQVPYTKPDPKAGPLWLEFASGFHPKAGGSGGVRIRVQAWEEGKGERSRLLEVNVKPGRTWREHAVNLSGYAGKKTVVRFTVGPGRDTKYDWFQWGAPRVSRLTDKGKAVLLDTEDLCERSQRGVVGWPYGELGPLANGALARPHIEKDKKNGLVVGDVPKPGLFIHPAWKDGHREPVYVQWTVDLTGERAANAASE
ncbi:MAG: glycosyl hydrolase family 28 protein [Planctomycetota bacterium]